MSSRAALAAVTASALLAAGPAHANVGDAFEQAKARVRAREDVAAATFWLDRATKRVAREAWRTNREEGWSYDEAKAISRTLPNGARQTSALHRGLGWANGGALYYGGAPELDAEGEPRYAGRVRTGLQWARPGRVSEIDAWGPDYHLERELEDAYEQARHLVAENEDQRE